MWNASCNISPDRGKCAVIDKCDVIHKQVYKLTKNIQSFGSSLVLSLQPTSWCSMALYWLRAPVKTYKCSHIDKKKSTFKRINGLSTLFKLSIGNTGMNKWKDVFTIKDIALPETLIWGSTYTEIHKHSHNPNPATNFPNEAVKVPQPQPVPLYKTCSQRNLTKIYTIYMRRSACYLFFFEVPISTKSPAKILHLYKKDSVGQALAVENITSNFVVYI